MLKTKKKKVKRLKNKVKILLNQCKKSKEEEIYLFLEQQWNKCFYFEEDRWLDFESLRTFWIKEQTQLGLLGNYTEVISQWSCTEICYCYHFCPKEGIVFNANDPRSACYQQGVVHQPSSSNIAVWKLCRRPPVPTRHSCCGGGGGGTHGDLLSSHKLTPLGPIPSPGFTCCPSCSTRQCQATALNHVLWYDRLNTKKEEIKQRMKSTRRVHWTNISN